MLVARLLRRSPDSRPGTMAAVACYCVAAAVLPGCAGSPAGNHAVSGAWRTEISATQETLYDVACRSALRCEAVGEAGTILSTADGGTTWTAQTNPLQRSSAALYRITCIAPSSCYVIARPNTILVTHDGGATWSTHVIGVGVSGTNLTDEGCLPQYTPISGRPALCRLGLLDIACVSASVCYAVAAAPSGYDTSPLTTTPPVAPSSIWMTSDGGASWTSQSMPPGVGCDGDCLNGRYSYPLVWASCLSSGLCRAGGGHLLCGHCGFAYAVLVTRGPGRPWICAGSAPACATLSPDAADCPTSTVCYGVQSTNPFGPDNFLVLSTDGGADWVQVGDWTAGVLNDIVCPAGLICYVVGSRGTIVDITNRSTVSEQPALTTNDLYGIGCAGPTTCYAVGSRGTILVFR